MQNFDLLYPLSYLLIVLGLVFAVVPILPGSLLIWLGIYTWASANGFRAFGWPTLFVLLLMMLVTLGSDLFLTALISRKAGASRLAILGAIVGGLLGGLLATAPLPIIGTILGGVAGSVIGILLVETLVRHDLGLALKAASGFILGYLASVALQLFLCLAMIAIFLLRAFVL